MGALASGVASGNEGAIAPKPDIAHPFSPASTSSAGTVDHSEWAALLRRYLIVVPGGINRFEYSRVNTADRARLKSYLKALQNMAPGSLNTNERCAYWINFYNALTVDVIVDRYPVKSILDITYRFWSFGPWDKKLVVVAGRQLSLNDIEHKILRANWREPRLHYALNCGSLGCPNLQLTPYSGGSLEEELDEASYSFVNDMRAVRIDDGRLTLSSIYRWYANDFGDSDAETIAHLRRFAKPRLVAQLTGISAINGYQYDWSLNAPSGDMMR